MMKNIIEFLKKEYILVISWICAIVSMFFVSPSADYLGYIDYKVLSLLFCLMCSVSGLVKEGLFSFVTNKIFNTSNQLRVISLLLVNAVFLSSMIITNDVALITFVPLTISIFLFCSTRSKILIIVLETIAANLGSMLTPIGNPQNLYLFNYYNLSPSVFFSAILPLGIASLVLINLLIFLLPNQEISIKPTQSPRFKELFLNSKYYVIILTLCLLTIFRVIPFLITLIITTLLIFFKDKSIFKKVDYSLLITFVAFFIFVGNIGKIETIRLLISDFLKNNELLSSIVLSQAISNVPCAVMLSGFTQDAVRLLQGVNIGGLGTIIASLASLISFKFYVKSKDSKPLLYLLIFTAVNVFCLILLVLLCAIKI